MHKRLPDRLKKAVTLLFPVTNPIFVDKTVKKGVKNRSKVLIYIWKVVVEGTGLEPIPWVSYLVIKCHKVSYSLGYAGHKWSYLVR